MLLFIDAIGVLGAAHQGVRGWPAGPSLPYRVPQCRVTPVRASSQAVGLRPLIIGSTRIEPPVVLAPMAGITNRAFRRLCRRAGAGLYVSEMVTARALVERNSATLDMVRFDRDETPRSLQLYGVDPTVIARAVRMVVAEDIADHVDLNFGCPVPKVTRKGGGSALPWKLDLFTRIVTDAVRAADGRIPVTVKMRKGIDDEHLTYLDAGRAAARAGVAWVALHARTAAQFYGPSADWTAIARLREALDEWDTPVLGNGDVWSADDALRMMAQTGADGVVVGRGCLGRPWLFAQLDAAMRGEPEVPEPRLAAVLGTLREHAVLLCADYGEAKGCRDIRKHMAWYLKGFRVRQHVRAALGNVSSLAELDALLGEIDADQDPDDTIARSPRGRTSADRMVHLPDRWLASPCLSEDERAILASGDGIDAGGG